MNLGNSWSTRLKYIIQTQKLRLTHCSPISYENIFFKLYIYIFFKLHIYKLHTSKGALISLSE